MDSNSLNGMPMVLSGSMPTGLDVLESAKGSERRIHQNKYVAPDFKRRQLIFDSFTKLKQANAQNQRGISAQVAGPKGTLLYTWGAGYHGQLGLSSYRKKCKLVPAWIEFKEPVLQVACGGFHTAVLTDTGRVYTWGDGRFGQLGNLARKHNMHATPHIVDRLAAYDINVVQISCGQYHTAAISSKGDMYSWGSGKYGQLGHGTRLDERYPRRVEVDKALGAFMQVSCGDRHTAAVTRRNQVVTFGSGQHGQLGHGNGWDFLKPKLVEALTHVRVTDVTSGSTTTCALTDTGALYLWGFGESIHPKELTNIVDTPRLVKMKDRIRQVACGQSHVLILTDSGDVYAFGNGGMGQIGHGAKSNVRAPRLVLRGKEICEIGAGRYHSMAVSAYGVLYSWGCGESGQLAHNSLENECFPRIVEAILPNVVGQICCGEHHSFCLSSIEHSSISQDVLNWKMIEDEELKLKKSMLKDHPNGLKSKHVLHVEQERQRIIAEITDGLRRDKELEQRYLEEQLDSITGRDALLKDVQETAHAKLASHEMDGTVPEAALIMLQNESAGAASILLPGQDITAKAGKAKKRGVRDKLTSLNTDPLFSRAHSQSTPALLTSGSAVTVGSSGIVLTSLKIGKRPNPRKNGSLITLSDDDEPEADHQYAGGKRGTRWMAAERDQFDRDEVDRNDLQLAAHRPPQVGTTEHAYSQEMVLAKNARPSTSPSPWLTRTKDANGNISPRSLATADGAINFQPLVPRMSFMEKTTNALARVKKFLQTTQAAALGIGQGVRPGTQEVPQELFGSKKHYNELRAVSKNKMAELENLRNSYLFMRPTEEDNNRSTASQMRIKDLNMKLVTLNTRLMEADENKKNYELYIMRMKEEDVQLSKQIDHLRHLVVEYDRLLAKMAKMNARVTSQKMEIDEEIVKFSKDIQDFSNFAHEQLQRYRSLIQRNVAEQRMQEKTVADRDAKSDEKRQKRVAKLQCEYDTAAEEITKIKDELDVWQENVAFYEQRFHKITAATGLSRPEDIVNKFFFNDEITADLSAEIEQRKQDRERLSQERGDLTSKLDEQKSNFVQSKWRDVDSLQTKLYDEKLRVSRRKEETDRLMQQLTFAKEGAIALVNAVDDAYGNDKRSKKKEQPTFNDEFEACLWWVAQMERRLSTLADSVIKKTQKDKRKKKRTSAGNGSGSLVESSSLAVEVA